MIFFTIIRKTNQASSFILLSALLFLSPSKKALGLDSDFIEPIKESKKELDTSKENKNLNLEKDFSSSVCNKENPSIYDLMKNRYTVRTFKSQNLEKGHLDQILGAGLLAPSKNKLYPYRVIVLTNTRKGRRLKKQLWSKYAICHHCSETGEPIEQRINSILTAPVNILFFLDLKPEGYEKNRPLSEIKDRLILRATRDAMIVVTAMMLQAEQLGYGTAFTGVHQDMHKFKKLLETPEESRFLVTLSLGYKEVPAKTIPKNYKSPTIDFDCQENPQKNSRHTVLKYTRSKKGVKIPAVITRSIDVGPKNKEKKHLIKKY